ncbi:hypothetical protein ACYULU_00925 [Breznakiellaceae bacterium SP9]
MAMYHWLPGKRSDRLALAKNWIDVLAVSQTAWNVPAADVQELASDYAAALGLLQKAQSAESTATICAQCKEAFEVLDKKMRLIKSHYFLIPPLLNSDLVSLGLHPQDHTSTPIPPPDGFAEADVSYPGVGTLELHCRPVAGQPPLDQKSDYGYRVYYGVMPQGGASVDVATGPKRELMKVPSTGEDLPHSLWVRHKKERFYFTGDSGKTAYFCLQYENNKGEAGPWGPLFSAIIP